MKKLISIVSPCYNEEENVRSLYDAVKSVMSRLPSYDYELIFIDNRSIDGTAQELRKLAAEDSHVKVIFNARNFGHIRSPVHGMLQAHGDATVLLASDLQDPPELIIDFVREWENGYRVVLGIKEDSEESRAMFAVRKLYYYLLSRFSEIQLVKNYTGLGLYDRKFMDILRELKDPYPYMRGLISEIGFEYAKIPFKQPSRKRGITKNNFYTLYDMAMLGFTSHSKVPLRLATMGGFALSLFSFLIGFAYLVAKLLFWYRFPAGTAPILIGVFVFSSVQIFFIGLLGEYVLAIHTQVLGRPQVIERERLGFDKQISINN